MIDYTHSYTRYNNLSFYGNDQLKQDLLYQLQSHYAHDQIIKGHYWQNGKGCHVGCCIHSNSHKDMSNFFGLPEWICYLFDNIFEGLPNDDAMRFPLESIQAIPVGVCLQPVLHKLAIWRLLDPERGVIRFSNDECIVDVAELHKKALIQEVSKNEWYAARSAAYSVDYATAAAAYSATAAAYSAACAAYSATAAADSATATAAADSATAAYSASADSATAAAYSAARKQHYQNESIQLISLLHSA
jgi:hypothetical protein